MARLENWAVWNSDYYDGYAIPNPKTTRLHGDVYDDTRYTDGQSILTSALEELDLAHTMVRTAHSVYRLGKASKKYLAWLEEQGYDLGDYV